MHINLTLNGKKLEAMPLKLGMSYDCPPSPLFFNIVHKAFAGVIKQEEKN